MQLSGSNDATDFRPFFDMVIGILFVLLILVAAQIYFQQVQEQESVPDSTRREEALRRTEMAAFVDLLAERLRSGGIRAVADIRDVAVAMPLRDILGIDGDGLPEPEQARVALLGATLSGLAGCVTLPAGQDPACPQFDRLHLERLDVGIRLAATPASATLVRDRFAALATTLLSASLLRATPRLIQVSNASGASVIAFRDLASSDLASSDLASSKASRPSADALDGDVVLDFTFR